MATEEKRLYLIDGHALVFKMYYALLSHPMINSKGVDTSILFGFTKYLFELIEKEHPTHLAVSFDPPGGTFRHDAYPDYKGTRSATPQLVIDALEPLCGICRALNIPVLMIPKYEADDVIGSMSKRAENEGFTVYMVTPDKDYGQLVTDRVLQLRPGKAGSENELLDRAKICEKYGVHDPVQVIDYLTICGDASDNVPGVKGVGEVGAKKLLGLYGSVQGIYDNLDKLTPKQRALFEAARDHIEMSRFLVTIKTDIDLSAFPTADMAVDRHYGKRIFELFDLYEFGSLKRWLGDAPEDYDGGSGDAEEFKFGKAAAAQVAEAGMRFGMVSVLRNGDRLLVAAGNGASESAVSGAGPDASSGAHSAAAGQGIIVAAGQGIIVAEGKPQEFGELLEDESVVKTGYALKDCWKWLRGLGIDMRGALYDIELMDYLINPEKTHRIDTLSRTVLGVSLEGDAAGGGKEKELSLFDSDPEDSGDSGFDRSREAAISLALGRKVREHLESAGLKAGEKLESPGLKAGETNDAPVLSKLYDEIEEPLIRVLAKMEAEGVKVDLNQLRRYSDSLSAELAQIQNRIREEVGEPTLNILSPKQIGVLLFEKLKLNPKIKAKKDVRYEYPTDEDTLVGLLDKHKVVGGILEYRAVRKLLSTYIEPFFSLVNPATGKIHTTFNQALTSTGRLSSSKPNLQNIPVRSERGKEIRKAFVPSRPDGLIVSADYSQIELRIMAHLSCDSHLIEAFRAGEDIHAMTASKIFGVPISEVTAEQRRIAKTANFGIMYGISAFGLAQRLRIARNEAKQIIDDYFRHFPSISCFIEDTLAAARENGYVETIFGRRRYVPDISSHNATVRALAERNAVNAPIQGTAADIIKMAMINVDRRMTQEGLRSRMVLQIHDELLFDAVPDEVEALKRLVVEEMENVTKLSVPLTVECNEGKNWLEAH